ncbi:MAG: hypothetical protein R3F29_04570 [Planctomycetota bacterium]
MLRHPLPIVVDQQRLILGAHELLDTGERPNVVLDIATATALLVAQQALEEAAALTDDLGRMLSIFGVHALSNALDAAA